MFDQRDEIQEKRLQHQLEMQSMQIEHVFNRHQMDAHVAGGTVKPRLISFNLQTQLATGLERLKVLTDDLMHTLGVPVSLSREDGVFRLDVSQRDVPPVSLLDLMSLLVELPPVTAVLGLAEDGRPVLLDFSEQDMTHILLSGVSGAGKTALLRSLAMSLALMNRQSRVQFVILDGASNSASGETALQALNYLPHMLANVIGNAEDIRETLAFLMNEVSYRLEYDVTAPTILVMIDEVVALLETGEPLMRDAIRFLAQRGADVGVHLVMSTEKPQAAVLDNLLKANISVQIVGRLATGEQAVATTGLQGSQAECLLGQGDFLAVAGQHMTHFQAAYIGDYDLHMTLQDLHRKRPPTLLAQAIDEFISLSDQNVDDPIEDRSQYFVFNGDAVALQQEEVRKVSLMVEVDEAAVEEKESAEALLYVPQPVVRLFHDVEMVYGDDLVIEEDDDLWLEEGMDELETADPTNFTVLQKPSFVPGSVKIHQALNDLQPRSEYDFPVVDNEVKSMPIDSVQAADQVPAVVMEEFDEVDEFEVEPIVEQVSVFVMEEFYKDDETEEEPIVEQASLFVMEELDEDDETEEEPISFVENNEADLDDDIEKEETAYESFEDDWLPFDDE